jgi:trigger factor
MNISLENNDAVSGVIKLEVVKADYAEPVEKSLRSLRHRANIPGFRTGMAPLGMIKKMYGKSVLLEEINKLVAEHLYKYIRDNKLNLLGEPLPSETEQREQNFNAEEDFEFCFDVAFAPEIRIELDKGTQTPFYRIIVDDEMVNKQVDAYRTDFGSYGVAESVEENDLIKGTITQLENDLPKEGGIALGDAVLMPRYISNEEEKAKFMGAALNSTVIFNPFKAYGGSAAEISAFLKIDKKRVDEADSDFRFELNEITRHTPAEVNQELFDKIFGENAVTGEEEFRNRIKSTLEEQFRQQSDYKFMLDIHDLLLEKAGELRFADNLLKRWLLTTGTTGKSLTPESVEAEYPKIIKDLKYQLIEENLILSNGIKVEKEDIDAYARRVVKTQFAQYGVLTVPDDLMDNYTRNMLKKEETRKNVSDRALEGKFTAWLKEQVALDVKEVTADEFDKLFEE